MIEKHNLTETELKANYDEFLTLISNTFSGERKDKLLHMYSESELGFPALMAPASMAEHFHYAFPGGYLLHITRVAKCVHAVKKLFEKMGGTIDFTDEEMMFAALHHDLGKLGDHTGEYYVSEDQDWKRRRGEIYRMNPNIQYMDVTERTLFVLQHYGIKVTWKESLSIRLSDGLYKEGNKSYLVAFNKDMYLKTELPRVLHWADAISAASERNTEMNVWKSV
jgi:hypothetical protein